MVNPGMAQTSEAREEHELTQLLHQFMEGATVNDPAMHDRFWAEDLIYTSSSGERFGKAEIMAGFSEEDNAEADTDIPSVSYSAEDIQIQVYDDMAVVAFRLVGRTDTEEGMQTDQYLNSGTFVKRDGQWKVVNWQATRVPE
jgi:hypothetical protein